jgi:hypothetical protein
MKVEFVEIELVIVVVVMLVIVEDLLVDYYCDANDRNHCLLAPDFDLVIVVAVVVVVVGV